MNKSYIILTAVAYLATAVCASASETETAGTTTGQSDAGLSEPALSGDDVNYTEVKVSQKKRHSEIVDRLKNNFRFYGFIRNYTPFDTRESTAGSGDLFYWVPKDQSLNAYGEDLNARPSFRMLALTSRVGVDISGYWIGDNEFGGRIEADFYAGLTGSTGTAQLRLRQAYMTLRWTNPDNTKYSIGLTAGQAWHPMASDLPDIFALDSGMPFGPFSRTPQLTTDFNLGRKFTITASALWQMQYTSMGPSIAADGKVTAASSADYLKYGLIPEFYLGLSYRTGGFVGKIGVDVTSLKPRSTATVGETQIKVKDRETSLLAFLYLQYTRNLFKVKAKTTYGGAGEHLNLMSGYAVSSISADNSLWEYTPIRSSSSWVSIAYGQKVQISMLLGYMKNLGTAKDIVAKGGSESAGDASYIFFQKNGSPNINQMYRIEPEIAYNVGRFTVGLEYMLTSVQYGDKSYNRRALSETGLHWVTNNRIEGVLRFTF